MTPFYAASLVETVQVICLFITAFCWLSGRQTTNNIIYQFCFDLFVPEIVVGIITILRHTILLYTVFVSLIHLLTERVLPHYRDEMDLNNNKVYGVGNLDDDDD